MPSDSSADASAAPGIRTSRRGGTGHQTWNSSHILSGVLLAWDEAEQEAKQSPSTKGVFQDVEGANMQLQQELPLLLGRAPSGASRRLMSKARTRCTLELGAGTGHLAVSLALSGWRGIFATDGEAAVVRNMKYNVQANRLGHAVRCMKWQWEDTPPKGLDLADVDLVIGSDLVYYNRAHGMLAAVLRQILTARSADDLRPPAQAFLLCCVRQAHTDGGGQIVHHLSNDGYAKSSMQSFVEEELPGHGLTAHRCPIPEQVFDALSTDPTMDVLASSENRAAYHLYEIEAHRDAPKV